MFKKNFFFKKNKNNLQNKLGFRKKTHLCHNSTSNERPCNVSCYYKLAFSNDFSNFQWRCVLFTTELKFPMRNMNWNVKDTLCVGNFKRSPRSCTSSPFVTKLHFLFCFCLFILFLVCFLYCWVVWKKFEANTPHFDSVLSHQSSSYSCFVYFFFYLTWKKFVLII